MLMGVVAVMRTALEKLSRIIRSTYLRLPGQHAIVAFPSAATVWGCYRL